MVEGSKMIKVKITNSLNCSFNFEFDDKEGNIIFKELLKKGKMKVKEFEN